jgi:hypothetical protein
LASQDLIKNWDRANDGRGVALLEELIVRRIRQWRPEVIVTEAASPRGDRPLAHIVNQLVLSSVRHAADPTVHPDHTLIAGLEPWTVKKVFSAADVAEQATVKITTAQLATRHGRSVADLASDGFAMILPQYHRRPVTVGFRLLLDELPQSAGRRDIFSGIFLQPGGEARRRLDLSNARDIESLARAAQKRRNIEQIFEQTAAASSRAAGWLGQVRDLTRSMSAASAGQVLYQLGHRYLDAGQSELAAQTFEHLVERYPDHALAESALVWLVQYYASSEVGRQLRQSTKFSTQQVGVAVTNATTAAGARPADHQQPVQEPASVGAVKTGMQVNGLSSTAGIGITSVERASRALVFAKMIQRGRPELFAEPWVQFPISVAYRNKGLPRDAERFYHRLSATPIPSNWTQCARAELWLSHGRGRSPKTIYTCKRGRSRPRLDGQLDDDIWHSATHMELTSTQHDDDAWPAAAMLAYDSEFLFLAVSCRKAPGGAYPSDPGPRPRDPDLADQDRVDFLIDIDRDYTSFYRLTVDHRGWTGEASLGNASWNPTWYVARQADETEWTVEAAIAWRELTPDGPRSNNVWALGVQRIVPGVGIQSFTKPASVQPRPEGFALLVFQDARGAASLPPAQSLEK